MSNNKKLLENLISQHLNETSVSGTWDKIIAMRDVLGDESFISNLIKAMGDDEVNANLNFIARMYDMVWVEDLNTYVDRDEYENSGDYDNY